MNQRFWDLLQELGGLAAAFGLAGLAYRFLTTDQMRQTNHQRLTRAVHWAAEAGWLDAMRTALRWALSMMSFIYGPPSHNASTWHRGMLTRMAWRMSAWIASCYVFVFSPAFLAIFASIDDSSQENYAVKIAMLSAALVAAVVHWKILSRIRREQVSRANGFQRLVSFEEIALISCGVLLAASIVAIVSVILAFYRESIPGEIVGMVALTGIIILAFSVGGYLIVQAISRYGFLSPIALAVNITSSAIICLPIPIATVLVFGIFSDDSHIVSELGTTGNAASIIGAASSIVFISSVLLKRAGNFSRTILILISASSSATVFSASGSQSGLLLLVAMPLTLFAVPIVFIYGIILSSSVPDWLSVGLTRVILGVAVKSGNLTFMIFLIFIDVVCAIAFLFAAHLIISASFGVAYVLASTAEFLAGSELYPSPPTGAFFEGLATWEAMGVLVQEGPEGVVSFLSSAYAERPGFKTALILSLVGVTALIPIALNCLAIVALLAGRALALVVGAPLRHLHGLLFVDEGGRPSDDHIFRSTMIYTVIIGIILLIIIIVYSTIST